MNTILIPFLLTLFSAAALNLSGLPVYPYYSSLKIPGTPNKLLPSTDIFPPLSNTGGITPPFSGFNSPGDIANDNELLIPVNIDYFGADLYAQQMHALNQQLAHLQSSMDQLLAESHNKQGGAGGSLLQPPTNFLSQMNPEDVAKFMTQMGDVASKVMQGIGIATSVVQGIVGFLPI